MVLDVALRNTQHYKVRESKVEQSRERSSAPPLHLGVVAIDLQVTLDLGRQLYLSYSTHERPTSSEGLFWTPSDRIFHCIHIVNASCS